jgi:hypothetical protein
MSDARFRPVDPEAETIGGGVYDRSIIWLWKRSSMSDTASHVLRRRILSADEVSSQNLGGGLSNRRPERVSVSHRSYGGQ